MSSLTRQEQLRQLLDEQQERLCSAFPTNRSNALVALTRARDWHMLNVGACFSTPTLTSQFITPTPYLSSSGWQKALQCCFSTAIMPSPISTVHTTSDLDTWADQVLLEYDALAAGEYVLGQCETGFMKMQQGGHKDFFAWIASKNMPTGWRVREDLAWWANALARMYEYERQELAGENVAVQQQLEAFVRQWQTDIPLYRTTQEIDDYYTRLGQLRVKTMACQFLYPDSTLIGGCTVELYRSVLSVLIGLALKNLDVCRAYVAQHPSSSLRALLTPIHDATALVEALSKTLHVEADTIRHAVETYSLSHENVSYHSSTGGEDTPAPPLLRLNEQHLAWSLMGLLRDPLFFLARELKRRYSYEYHTASHVHEVVFRQDLYRLFADKRFVKSAGTIELRGVQGGLTTDVDALIFDRKTGTLALFELKSQDPFAYSHQERLRQRDYFYNAGKQVLACLQWLNRNGANALLTRLDQSQVKRLKVQKTYIFVLGRYLAHFFDAPPFYRRAAWGTWPQVLRLLNDTPFGAEDAQPIQSLYNKLLKDTPLVPSNPPFEVQEIMIGESTIYVYPDFETYKNRTKQ